MSTTLYNAKIALSKDIGDWWSSTTTDAGAATSLVDTALLAKQADWVTDEAYVILTSEPAGAASIYDERKVSSLASSTLTTLAFAAAPGTGITYDLNRIFSPSDQRLALINASKAGFPYIHNKVRDETHRAGNWLKDGSMEIWTSTSALTNWTKSALTETQTSTTKLFIHGNYSCKLSTAAGYIGQSISDNDDLKFLRGKHVIFKGRGWCDTASCLRLAIYDGTTTTYSPYDAGTSTWNDIASPWYIEAYISPTATEVSFRVYFEVLTAIAYVDDLEVIGPTYPKIYIHELGLANDYPVRVSYFPRENEKLEPFPINDFEIDTDYIYLQDDYAGCKLRIEGLGYLDFLASGVASTAWTATIAIDEPQVKILSAEAAIYLYNQQIGNYTSGGREYATERLQFWIAERQRRVYQYAMDRPKVRIKWGV
jgi:hypothetical protein